MKKTKTKRYNTLTRVGNTETFKVISAKSAKEARQKALRRVRVVVSKKPIKF